MTKLAKYFSKEAIRDRKIKKERARFFAKQREKYHKELIAFEEKNAEAEKIAPENVFLSLKNINKIYDNHVQAVYDFNLDVKKNEFIVFVGPSGCGKSTTLRMIAGLEDITSGDLFINGVYANNLLPKERFLSMVFQSYALYPHMSVYDNLSFGLKIKKESKEVIYQKVHEVAKLLEIDDYLNRKPKELSGGQCQRVALGRAIMRDVPLFLMDEPLSNLDAKLRVQMRGEIVKLHNAIKATTIYVTHDQTEAMTMADRIVIMNKGYIQQIGTPEEIYNNPANSFVASFIGSPAMNIVKAKLIDEELFINDNLKIKLDKEAIDKVKTFYTEELNCLNSELKKAKEEYQEEVAKIKKEKYKELFASVYIKDKEIENKIEKIKTYFKENVYELSFGVRPEDIIENSNGKYSGKVDLSELLGSEYYLHFKVGNNDFVAKTSTDKKYVIGEEFRFDFNLSKTHIFCNLSGKTIL